MDDSDSFLVFSKVWIEEKLQNKSETYRAQAVTMHARFVWPEIGAKRLAEVKLKDVLKIIGKSRETPVTASEFADSFDG